MRHPLSPPPFPKDLRLEAPDKTEDLKDGICDLFQAVGPHFDQPIGGNVTADTEIMACLLRGESHDSPRDLALCSVA